MSVILHLLKFCDHQTAVYVTTLKMSHFKHIFSDSVKLFCKRYILYSVLVLKLGSVINTPVPTTDLNSIKNRVIPHREHTLSPIQQQTGFISFREIITVSSDNHTR